MSFNDIQECKRCGGSIDRDHFATVDDGDDAVTTMLYCSFCEVVRESCWTKGPKGQLSYEYSLDYQAKTEPIAFGKALQRLEDARVAGGIAAGH